MNAITAALRPDTAVFPGAPGGSAGFARGHARRRGIAIVGLVALAGLILAGAAVGERAVRGEAPAPGVFGGIPGRQSPAVSQGAGVYDRCPVLWYSSA